MMISMKGRIKMIYNTLDLFIENEDEIRNKSGVKFIVGREDGALGIESIAKNQCDKPTCSFNIIDLESLEKCFEYLSFMEKNEKDIIIIDLCDLINDIHTIKKLTEIAESQKIKIIICKNIKSRKNNIFREAEIFDGILPEIDYGVGINSYTTYSEKVLIGKAVGRDFLSDNVMYIVNCNGVEVKNYYEKVHKRCDEINEVLLFTDQSVLRSACPKIMFCFDSQESCMHFKKGFDQLTDRTEMAQWGMTYGSVSNMVSIWSVFVDLVKLPNG